MHKKYALHLAGLAAAAVLTVHAAPVLALTAAHMATATGATQGDCSVCHVAHKAAGSQRLFPAVIAPANIAVYGFMGGMCAEYCHNQVVLLPRAYAGNTALVNVGSSTLSTASHGLNLSGVGMPPATVVAGTLPYGDGIRGRNSQGVLGSFECTTCHDPHKNATAPAVDASNALLRLDIDALCDECHSQRGSGDAAWSSGYGDANALGSHPVGTDVGNDSDAPGNSNIYIGGVGAGANTTSFDVLYGAASAHNLGGHMIDGGNNTGASGITCVTCHAVHGNQADGGAAQPPAPTGPFEDLLVVSQGVMGATEPTRSANGGTNANTSNALCNGCHMYGAGDSWNPGATAYSHPSDGMVANANMGVIVNPFPAAWPVGNTAASAFLDIAVICETCHDPHGASAGSHILRLDEQLLCQACHTTGPANHHPSGVPMGAMADAAIDTANIGTLDCSDCHQGNGAHNWAAAGAVGLNPAWEPTDNKRLAAQDAVGVFTLNISKECVDCHATGAGRNSPTLHNGNASTNGGTDTLENRGNGSHFVGGASNVAGNGNMALGQISGAAFNSFTTVWPSGVLTPGYSRYGGTGVGAYEMTCEACHELEFDKNVPGTALLLYNYHDRENQPTSRFCTGCHGEVPGGSSVHPLTGSTISAAVDAGRGTQTLINDPASGYANAAGAPQNAEYPGNVTTNNRMNCDSCHQPHDAPTDSGTFILEFNDGVGTGLAASTVSTVVLPAHRATTAMGIEHNTLCVQCHNY